MSTVTIGATDYTTYSDVVEADEYFNGSTRVADWAAFSDDEKARGLVSSTRLLDRQVYQGAKEDSDQSQEFPRTGLTSCQGVALEPEETTPFAVEASQLLALDILSGESTETSATTEDLTKKLKAGSVEIENFRASSNTATRFSLAVMELIGCLLSSGSTITGSISTGTDGEAVDNDFTVTIG